MNGSRRSRALTLAVACVAACAVASPSADASDPTVVVHGASRQILANEAFDGPLPVFEQRTVTTRGALEPSIAFDADGSMFYTSFVYGDPTVLDIPTKLFRSDDQGLNWIENTPQILGVPFNDQGGDPYLYRDEITGRLFYVLYSHDDAHIAWTDDGGATWGRPLHLVVHEPAVATDYPKLWTSKPVGAATTPAGAPFYVHICYNALYRLACQRSIDGGLTFAPSPTPYPESLRDYMVDTCWSFHTGWGFSGPDGTIYMAKPYCGNLEVAVSRDNGLTWERRAVADDVDPLGLQETRMAMDRSGNLYFLWLDAQGDFAGGTTPMLSISTDGGETWSDSIDVGIPGLTAAKFPSIVAGDQGRIAFFYVGSDVPGGFGASEQQMQGARWDAYVSFSLNALDDKPVFTTAMVNPADDPLRRGPCAERCETGPVSCYVDCSIAGTGTIGMFDYLQMALDPTTGTVAASLVDLCTGACGTATGTSDDPWSFIGAIGLQTEGPSLFE